MFVGSAARLLASGGKALVGSTNAGKALVSVCSEETGSGSFLQPCIKRANRPIPWIASTTKTAMRTRARPLFFGSDKEPCGIRGL